MYITAKSCMFKIFFKSNRWSRTNPNFEQTQTSHKPKLRTNPNFEQAQTSNKFKLRTNPKLSDLRGT